MVCGGFPIGVEWTCVVSPQEESVIQYNWHTNKYSTEPKLGRNECLVLAERIFHSKGIFVIRSQGKPQSHSTQQTSHKRFIGEKHRMTEGAGFYKVLGAYSVS